MGKFLVTCAIVILFILLQTDVIVSTSRKGSSSRKPGRPSKPSKPVERPRKPAEKPSAPEHKPPRQSEKRPAQPPPHDKPINPPRNSPDHPNNPNNPPPYNPAYAPQNPVNPQNPERPPQNPVNPGNPPPYNPAYPPQNPVNPPNPQHPPPYPVNPQNPGHPPPYPVNPVNPQNPGHPPPYPVNPQNPGHPPPYPVNPQNPGHPPPYPANPQNPGYFPHNPGYQQYPHWGQYNSKPWKPKPPKNKMKFIAGAAVAGAAVGAFSGFFLGRTMSHLPFRFNSLEEEQWWYQNRNRYFDRVYYPRYPQPVPQDVFVRDCVNITVKEFIEPSGNETEDEMEATVVKHVVREMCIEQYRTFSSSSEVGSISRDSGNPMDPKPNEANLKQVSGEAIIDAAVEDPHFYVLGSPISNTYFHFNNSEEERWWNENRHRFATHAYHPNYSQPVSKDVFLRECVKVTIGEYMKPSGNQTEDELEARVVLQVANEKCLELYHLHSALRAGGGHKPATPTTLAKVEIKHEAGRANLPNSFNNAVSYLHFSFEDTLLLTNPIVVSVLLLVTPFLIF